MQLTRLGQYGGPISSDDTGSSNNYDRSIIINNTFINATRCVDVGQNTLVIGSTVDVVDSKKNYYFSTSGSNTVSVRDSIITGPKVFTFDSRIIDLGGSVVNGYTAASGSRKMVGVSTPCRGLGVYVSKAFLDKSFAIGIDGRPLIEPYSGASIPAYSKISKITLSIGASSKLSPLASYVPYTALGDGTVRFSHEPVHTFFGMGCAVIIGGAEAYLGERVSENTWSVFDKNGDPVAFSDQVSGNTNIYHAFIGISDVLNASTGLSARFFSDLVASKINVRLAVYNDTGYANKNFNMTYLPAMDVNHRVTFYAPRGMNESIIPQCCEPTFDANGFGVRIGPNTTKRTRPLITVNRKTEFVEFDGITFDATLSSARVAAIQFATRIGTLDQVDSLYNEAIGIGFNRCRFICGVGSAVLGHGGYMTNSLSFGQYDGFVVVTANGSTIVASNSMRQVSSGIYSSNMSLCYNNIIHTTKHAGQRAWAGVPNSMPVMVIANDNTGVTYAGATYTDPKDGLSGEFVGSSDARLDPESDLIGQAVNPFNSDLYLDIQGKRDVVAKLSGDVYINACHGFMLERRIELLSSDVFSKPRSWIHSTPGAVELDVDEEYYSVGMIDDSLQFIVGCNLVPAGLPALSIPFSGSKYKSNKFMGYMSAVRNGDSVVLNSLKPGVIVDTTDGPYVAARMVTELVWQFKKIVAGRQAFPDQTSTTIRTVTGFRASATKFCYAGSKADLGYDFYNNKSANGLAVMLGIEDTSGNRFERNNPVNICATAVLSVLNDQDMWYAMPLAGVNTDEVYGVVVDFCGNTITLSDPESTLISCIENLKVKNARFVETAKRKYPALQSWNSEHFTVDSCMLSGIDGTAIGITNTILPLIVDTVFDRCSTGLALYGWNKMSRIGKTISGTIGVPGCDAVVSIRFVAGPNDPNGWKVGALLMNTPRVYFVFGDDNNVSVTLKEVKDYKALISHLGIIVNIGSDMKFTDIPGGFEFEGKLGDGDFSTSVEIDITSQYSQLYPVSWLCDNWLERRVIGHENGHSLYDDYKHDILDYSFGGQTTMPVSRIMAQPGASAATILGSTFHQCISAVDTDGYRYHMTSEYAYNGEPCGAVNVINTLFSGCGREMPNPHQRKYDSVYGYQLGEYANNDGFNGVYGFGLYDGVAQLDDVELSINPYYSQFDWIDFSIIKNNTSITFVDTPGKVPEYVATLDYVTSKLSIVCSLDFSADWSLNYKSLIGLNVIGQTGSRSVFALISVNTIGLIKPSAKTYSCKFCRTPINVSATSGAPQSSMWAGTISTRAGFAMSMRRTMRPHGRFLFGYDIQDGAWIPSWNKPSVSTLGFAVTDREFLNSSGAAYGTVGGRHSENGSDRIISDLWKYGNRPESLPSINQVGAKVSNIVTKTKNPTVVPLSVLDSSADSNFSGYDVTYYLKHNAKHEKYIDVINTGATEEEVRDQAFEFTNLASISAHANYLQFIKKMAVYVDKCDTHRVVSASGDANWKTSHVAKFTGEKASFVGCLYLESLLSGAIVTIETNPEHTKLGGTGVITASGTYGHEVMTGSDVYDDRIYANTLSFTRDSGFANSNPDLRNRLAFQDMATKITSAIAFSDNMPSSVYTLIIRNLRIQQPDKMPLGSGIGSRFGFIDTKSCSDISIYNNVLAFFFGIGKFGDKITRLDLVNNNICEYLYHVSQNFPSIGSENGQDSLYLFPSYVDSDGTAKRSVPDSCVANVYNNGIIAWSSASSKDRFPSGTGMRITGNQQQLNFTVKNNKVSSPIGNQIDFRDTGSSNMSITTVNVQRPELFGDGLSYSSIIDSVYKESCAVDISVWNDGLQADNSLKNDKIFCGDNISYDGNDKEPWLGIQSILTKEVGSDSNTSAFKNGDIKAARIINYPTDIVRQERVHKNTNTIDIGAYYIEAMRTGFNGSDIISIRQSRVYGNGFGVYRTDAPVKIMSGVGYDIMSVPGYLDGAKMIIALRPMITQEYCEVYDREFQVAAKFENVFFDRSTATMISPKSGKTTDGRTLPSTSIDHIFANIMSGKYFVSYDYSTRVMTVFIDPTYYMGMSGSRNPMNTVRYSENMVAIK